MARRKGGDESEIGHPDAKRSDLEEQITPNQLKSLVRSKNANNKSLEDVRLLFKKKYDDARREQHLDAWAFRVIMQLEAMDLETQAEKIPVLLYYLDASGLSERVTQVGRLPLNDAVDPPPKTAAAKPSTRKKNKKDGKPSPKVVPNGDGAAREVAETAGSKLN